MSNNMLNYGCIEELYLLGCTTKTIANITKQPLSKVEKIIYQIEKNRRLLAKQNKVPAPTVGRQTKIGY